MSRWPFSMNGSPRWLIGAAAVCLLGLHAGRSKCGRIPVAADGTSCRAFHLPAAKLPRFFPVGTPPSPANAHWHSGRVLSGPAPRTVSAQSARAASHRSITDRSTSWPTWGQWRRLLLLEDYNTRVVMLSTGLLGCAAGLVGSFTLIRKRALMGDALSHATLPGIALAFIAATSWGGPAKSLPLLLLGATVTGMLGMGAIVALRRGTRLKEDTALGAVMSVFFGAGIALLGVVQQMRHGHAAGLEAFIYGKTASMGAKDSMLIGAAALLCVTLCVLLFKEFKLLCFDEAFAHAHGFPVVRLDVTLMGLVVVTTIVGLQAVGLILMIALLVIPAAAARFWTERLRTMIVIAACLGAAGGMLGASLSALFARVPSGPVIVLVCTVFFLFSLVFGASRGLLVRWMRRAHVNRTVDRHDLLRAIYEIVEAAARPLGRDPLESAMPPAVSFEQLLAHRTWTPQRLRRAIRRAQRAQLVEWNDGRVRLTRRGAVEAARWTRQHRLWELYLITHADVAPSRVDRDADAIEHVLEPELVAELEFQLEKTPPSVPASPHAVSPAGGKR